MRTRSRVDSNHAAIADALRACGCRVLSLAALGKGVPDLLVCDPWGNLHLLEVKSEKGKLLPAQQAFCGVWPVTVVRTAQEAVRAVVNERKT